MNLPARFESVAALDDFMTIPPPELLAEMRTLKGDILVLGVGGKMGPTLARMPKRADPERRVIGVARFSEPGLRSKLAEQGVECIEADLLSREAIAKLPDAPNVVFMAGRKFGSTGSEWLTWAMNAHVPALVAERFAKSRIVAFSTACAHACSTSTGHSACPLADSASTWSRTTPRMIERPRRRRSTSGSGCPAPDVAPLISSDAFRRSTTTNCQSIAGSFPVASISSARACNGRYAGWSVNSPTSASRSNWTAPAAIAPPATRAAR